MLIAGLIAENWQRKKKGGHKVLLELQMQTISCGFQRVFANRSLVIKAVVRDTRAQYTLQLSRTHSRSAPLDYGESGTFCCCQTAKQKE